MRTNDVDRRTFFKLAAAGVVMSMIPQGFSISADLKEIERRVENLESSPDLSGATITGGIIRTRQSGPRIEITQDTAGGGDGGRIDFLFDDDTTSSLKYIHGEGLALRADRASDSKFGAVFIDAATLSMSVGSGINIDSEVLVYPDSVVIATTDVQFYTFGGGIQMHGLPTRSGVQPNLYLDPTTGQLSRIS